MRQLVAKQNKSLQNERADNQSVRLGDEKDQRTVKTGKRFQATCADSWGQEWASNHGKEGATGQRKVKTKSGGGWSDGY
jgi:hypothetical protein